jgi:hypothetical protein
VLRVILILLPAVASAQERARLLGLRAGGDAAASSIELIGDRPLSFTTLKLAGPPRVVVDLADTDVSPQVGEIAVDDGTIKSVAAAAAGQRTARVVIELAADAEFDVRAHGSSLEVRIPRPAPAVAEAAPRSQQPLAQEMPKAEAPAAQPPKRERMPARAVALAQKAETVKQSRPAPPKPAPKPPPAQRKLAMVQRHSITGIGFRPIDGGEVIVRSDHPLEYGVSGEGNAVLLHLPSAGIPLPNNRRPLDTHYFGGPVQRVIPLAKENGTDVRIELDRHADYQLAQSGTVLTVTFSPPR